MTDRYSGVDRGLNCLGWQAGTGIAIRNTACHPLAPLGPGRSRQKARGSRQWAESRRQYVEGGSCPWKRKPGRVAQGPQSGPAGCFIVLYSAEHARIEELWECRCAKTRLEESAGRARERALRYRGCAGGHGAWKRKPGCSAGPAVRPCRVFRARARQAWNTARWRDKPAATVARRSAGKAPEEGPAGLESEPCATGGAPVDMAAGRENPGVAQGPQSGPAGCFELRRDRQERQDGGINPPLRWQDGVRERHRRAAVDPLISVRCLLPPPHPQDGGINPPLRWQDGVRERHQGGSCSSDLRSLPARAGRKGKMAG